MIKMEHPTLPKKVDDPPVQLWSMKKDENVSTPFLSVNRKRSEIVY